MEFQESRAVRERIMERVSSREVSMRITAFALFVLFVPLAAQAQTALVAPAKPASPVCLRQDMVWGWKVVDDKTLIVTDKVQKAYQVSLKPGCHDLKWHLGLGFKSYSGMGISCLARNDTVIVPPDPGMPPQRCFISDIVAYTPPPVPPK
jgi:hypothetical protein